MAKKVLSIEVGQQVTKAVVIDYLKRNPHVYSAFSFDTPPDVVEDGFIRDKPMLAQLIQNKMNEQNIKVKDVVFSISSTRIASREVIFPFVSDAKLDELVHATAQDYFPVNIEEYTLAYIVQNTVKEENKKSLKVLLLAAPDSLIQNYYAFADELGVSIQSLDYYGNGSMQVLSKHVIEGYCLCVQMGSQSTMVSVLADGRQIMQRTISFGVNTIMNAVLEQPDLNCKDETDAMQLLYDENVLYSNLDYEDLEGVNAVRLDVTNFNRSHQSEVSRQAVTDSVGSIILSILRVIDYFHSKNPDVEIAALYLTGMGVKIRGIDLLFANEMGIPVQRLQKLNNITFSRAFPKNDQTEYIAAIGAAIAPIDFRLKSLVEKETHKEAMRAIRLVFVMAIVVSVVLIGWSALMWKKAVDMQATLEAEITELAGVKVIYEKNAAASAKVAEAEVIDAAASTENHQLIELISQYEKVLPKMMKVTSMTSSNDGVTLTIETNTKISVAQVLMSMENIKILTNFSVATVSGDEESKKYIFSVVADYAEEDDNVDVSDGGTGN